MADPRTIAKALVADAARRRHLREHHPEVAPPAPNATLADVLHAHRDAHRIEGWQSHDEEGSS